MSDPTPDAAMTRPPSAHVDALGTAACVLLALATIGFAAFRRFAGALPTGASHNADRTFFTSVNAVTLTGFEQSFAEVPNFPIAGKALLAFLAVGGATTTLICGGLFVRAIVGATIGTRAIVILSAATIAVPLLAALPIGAFDATSAATTLGLAGQYALTPIAIAALVALSMPAAVGPVGWAALFDRRRASPTLNATLVACAAVYLVGTILLASVGRFSGGVATLHGASALAVDARGLGLNAAWPATLGAAGQWVIVALMSIGSPPGGTRGGVGLLPLVLIGGFAWRATRGRAGSSPLVGIAIVWVASWIAALLVATVALAATQPQLPGDRLLFIAVSALSNTGLSHDPISFTGVGLVTLAATMIVGRLLPLAMLCWMATAADRSRRLDSPQRT